MLLAAAVLNYLDRTALGVVSAHIKDEFQLSGSDYASIVSSFLIAYTISYFVGGLLADRFGTRLSVTATLVWWSVSNMAHGLAQGLTHLRLCRFSLGLGEAAFYPAAIRTISEWFPATERSKAVGMLLFGSSLGGILAPLVVGPMMAHPQIGWRGAFVVTGALGFLLLPFWLKLVHRPEDHPALSTEERASVLEGRRAEHGSSTAVDERWSVGRVLRQPQAWVLISSRALTDAAYYVLLFWLLLYFQKGRGFTDGMVAAWGWIPFATADLGALAGGWASSRLVTRGWSVVRARKVCMVAFALMLPAGLLCYVMPPGPSIAALVVCSLATFGHMAYGTNSLTLHGDLFPPGCVATVMGITGAAGSLAGVAAQNLVGMLVDMSGNYLPVFAVTAILHPLAAAILLLFLRPTRQAGGLR